MPDSLRPEAALLLECARQRVGTSDPDRMAWLLPRVNRSSFLKLCRRNRMLPAAAEMLPELGEYRLALTIHNMEIASLLARLDAMLESEGVCAVWLKGPVLSQQLFGGVACREFCDLDLLVAPGEVERAVHVLESAGYRAPEYWRHASAAAVRWQAEVTLEGEDLTPVDLHWRLFPSLLPFDASSAEPAAVDMFGRRIRTLAGDDLLLYLCLHGAKHAWWKLAWLMDAAMLLPGRTAHPAVDLARALAADLLGLSAGEANAPAELVRAVRARVLGDEENPPGTGELSRFLLALDGSAPTALRYYSGLAFTPTEADWNAVALPPALHFLYPLARVARHWRGSACFSKSPAGRS